MSTDNPPKRERDRALRGTLFLCMRQLQGVGAEEKGAHELGFGSVEAMRTQLANWGVPDWLIRDETAAEKPKPPKPSGPERKARGSGSPKRLPPADGAAPLLRERLEALSRTVEELEHRKETLQGGRFFSSGVHGGMVHLSRGSVSDEQWEHVREALGLDTSAKDYTHFGGAAWSLGGGTADPAAPLPALIGAYLLAGGEVEPLVKALHPDPSSAAWEKIRKRIEDRKSPRTEDGITAIAQQIAKLVRGGELKPGRDPAEMADYEVNLASRITELREQGWADEDIHQKLRQLLYGSDKELSWDEFQRLAKLEQRFPWS